MLYRMNLRTKLLTLLFVPLCIFMVTTIMAIIRIGIMTDELQTLYLETTNDVRLIDSAYTSMNKALVAQRTLIFSDYKSQKYASIYDDYLDSLQEVKRNTELVKSFNQQESKLSELSISTSRKEVLKLINQYFNAFEQWEMRSNTIIESMSTRGLTGENKLVYQSLILDEAIAADEKFNLASKAILDIETMLSKTSTNAMLEMKDKKKQLELYYIVIATLTFVVAITFSLFVSRTILNSIKQLVNLTKKVARGDLSTETLTIRSKDEVGLLADSFIAMCKRLKQYIDIVYVSKLKEKEAELRALQLQIQPHFLFNTLEGIRMRAIASGELQVAKMVKILADIYRWNVKDKQSIVSLEEEIAYTKSYFNLQEIRFQDRLHIETNIPCNILHLGVPKLIIQPLIENAIDHGFKNKAEACLIKLDAYLDQQDLIIECTDNGVGMETKDLMDLMQLIYQNKLDTNKVGLKNVHTRLSLLFGEPYGLTIKSVYDEGSKITLRLPNKNVQEMKEFYV
jgi:sensor histidine kinase YesM